MARRKQTEAVAEFDELERLLEHRFERRELLTLALTHRSWVYDRPGSRPDDPEMAEKSNPSKDNEQLEFMGDAALGLLVAEILCQRFPASREGELTRMRAGLVSRQHLGEVGLRLELGRWLRLGPTTQQTGGRQNAAILSNAIEATIAALYLDGGLEAARRFVEREVIGQDAARVEAGLKDDKTALQELAQAESLGKVIYVALGESGPPHARTFRAGVKVEGVDPDALLAEAEGSTKKLAQKEAARLALAELGRRGVACR
jgi:ribonuclease-3